MNLEEHLIALASGDYVRCIAIYPKSPRDDTELAVALNDAPTEITTAGCLLRGRNSIVQCLVVDKMIIPYNNTAMYQE
jgi:hypothetical protein